jgi:hypothetical protein
MKSKNGTHLFSILSKEDLEANGYSEDGVVCEVHCHAKYSVFFS